MMHYVLKRLLLGIPLLFGVNMMTFLLFFCVNSATDVTYKILGDKHVHPVTVYHFKNERQYHLPRFWHSKNSVLWVGPIEGSLKTLFSSRKHHTLSWEDFAAADPSVFMQGILTQNMIVVFNARHITPELVEQFLKEVLPWGIPVIEYLSSHATGMYSTVVQHAENETQLHAHIMTLTPKGIEKLTQTLFFKKSFQLLFFEFGISDRTQLDIGQEIRNRAMPSLMITLPAFLIGLLLEVSMALFLAYHRGRLPDRIGLLVTMAMISVMSLFYVFAAHWVFSVLLKWFPVSGFNTGFAGIKFILLPVFVAVADGLAGGIRFYRTLFLEEFEKDYVKTAYAKGLSSPSVVFKHILPNVMLPIVTNTVVVIPRLFMGSLILEYFFAIPGLGGFTLEGILAEDFAVVGSMTFLGAFLYVVGLILTDVCYAYVDPRVRVAK